MDSGHQLHDRDLEFVLRGPWLPSQLSSQTFRPQVSLARSSSSYTQDELIIQYSPTLIHLDLKETKDHHRRNPPPESSYPPMAPGPALFFFLTVLVSSVPALAASGGAGCAPGRCGNVTVSTPLGIVAGAEENGCAQLGFQVHCAG